MFVSPPQKSLRSLDTVSCVVCVCVIFVSPTPRKPLLGLDTVSCDLLCGSCLCDLVWYLVCIVLCL